MLKGSVYNDSLWANMGFENYPHILNLLHAIRARPEFKGLNVIANPKPLHEYMEKSINAAVGVKIQLYLPIYN